MLGVIPYAGLSFFTYETLKSLHRGEGGVPALGGTGSRPRSRSEETDTRPPRSQLGSQPFVPVEF